jgi:hypothetical protein
MDRSVAHQNTTQFYYVSIHIDSCTLFMTGYCINVENSLIKLNSMPAINTKKKHTPHFNTCNKK